MASLMRLMCLLCTSLFRCDLYLVASQATSLELSTLVITVNLIKISLNWLWADRLAFNLFVKVQCVKLMPV